MFAKFLGASVFIIGVGLIIGNVTGIFPTFTFAGFITTVIGSLIYNAGEREIQ